MPRRQAEVPSYKPLGIHLTEEELDDMRDRIEKGELPPDAIELQREAEARMVFGVDAKKDAKGNFIEQGIGSRGNESANHFASLARAERDGFEPPGAYRAALAEIWRRDPERAKKLGLPQPPPTPEPRTGAGV
jgi:hypothetical protein